MDRENLIARYYLETGILGAYETAEMMWDEEVDGKYAPCFEDALLIFHPEQTSMERVMIVESKRFRIRSIFPANIGATPTDKMLELIDSELEKEARTA